MFALLSICEGLRDVWVEAGEAGLAAEQVSVASPVHPSVHRGEGEQVRSELSCVGEKAVNAQLVIEIRPGQCLMLLISAGVWGGGGGKR